MNEVMSRAPLCIIQYLDTLTWHHGGRGRRDTSRQTSRSVAALVQSDRPMPVQAFTSSSHLLGGLPLPLFPCTLPSKSSFLSEWCRLMWPKYASFLCLMSDNNFLCTCRRLHTSSFVTLSVHLTLAIFLRVHISKALILFSMSLFNIHVSQP